MNGIRRATSNGVREGLILMEPDRIDERLAPVIESGLPFVAIAKPEEFPQGSVVDFEMPGWMVVERALEEECSRLHALRGARTQACPQRRGPLPAGVEETAQDGRSRPCRASARLSSASELAVRVLVCLLRSEGATSRIALVEPRWLGG